MDPEIEQRIEKEKVREEYFGVLERFLQEYEKNPSNERKLSVFEGHDEVGRKDFILEALEEKGNYITRKAIGIHIPQDNPDFPKIETHGIEYLDIAKEIKKMLEKGSAVEAIIVSDNFIYFEN